MKNQVEIWKALPGVTGVEVSTLGKVRTLDKMVWNGRGTWLMKGIILKQDDNGKGYLRVGITIDGKRVMRSVHRLVAQTFLPNPDNLPQVNHLDCNRKNNHVENLEFCDNSYNQKYREKYGKALSQPVFAINLTTLEVSWFESQIEASRALGIDQGSISNVIKGKAKRAGGYWFKEDDGNGIEIGKDKINDIVDGMRFRGGVLAVNLATLEVSRFPSRAEASRAIRADQSSIGRVIKGKQKQTGGYFFVNDDGHAVEVVKSKLHDIGKTGLILS